MEIPKNLYYTKSHEWVRQDGDKVIVGITAYAQHEISDVVFVELPKLGTQVSQGKSVCIVESVKAAFDIYAPVTGTIKAINTTLESDPGLINQDPYGKGWLFELSSVDISQLGTLMKSDQYENVIKAEK